MASPQPTWRASCFYRVYRPHQSSSTKVLPKDQFKFDIYVDSRSVDATARETNAPLIRRSDLFIGCKSFLFQEGRAFLRTHLSTPFIPSQTLDRVIEGVITKVRHSLSFEFDERSFAFDDGDRQPLGFFVFPLVLKVIVGMWEEEQEDMVTAVVMEEQSMQAIRMVPASMEAIENRKKFGFKIAKRCNVCMEDLEDFDGGDEVVAMPDGHVVHLQCLKKLRLIRFKFAKQCVICMEDFDFDGGGDQVLPMPCGHVFHQHCLVQWLHTSHTCPLCRFSMPTANN